MKKITTMLLASMLGLAWLAGQTADFRPYGVRSGIIEYTYSGDKVGKGTLYFDDWGIKSASYTEAVENGEKGRVWVVTTSEYQYIWSPDESEGLKMPNPLKEWAASNPKGSIESFTEYMYSQIGLTRGAGETFLDRDCMVMNGGMGKVLTWHGLIILLDMKMARFNSHQEATSVQVNIPVDAKHFIIPKGIKFFEIPGYR